MHPSLYLPIIELIIELMNEVMIELITES